MKSTTQVYNEITEILTDGAALISPEEKEKVLTTFKTFTDLHPDHIFLSKKERYEQNIQLTEAEKVLWNRIQPILDKAQGTQPCARKSPK